MTRRNQLLALFCLLAFAGLGVLYFQHWVVQKPFGIVLFIGEGLTPGRLAPTRTFGLGAEGRLAFDEMPQVALVSNYSNDFATPDQAAAASSIATGVRVDNHALSVTRDGKNLETLIELARKFGRATGIVTDTSLTSPTLAAFYSHGVAPFEPTGLALDLVQRGIVDVALGGGSADFLPQNKAGHRQDGRDLLLEARRNGFDVVGTRAQLEAVPGWRRPKMLGLFSQGELAFADLVRARSEQPALADLVRRAIELLQFNRNGYLLVIDAGLMRRAAQTDEVERTLAETLELDRALAMARRYAGENSLVIVCGDVGVGGLSLNGFPFLKDSGVALLGMNSAGAPWFTWATGPNAKKRVPGPLAEASPGVQAVPEAGVDVSQEPAALYAPLALNTAEDVIAFATGPGSEAVRGSIHATAIHRIIRDNF